MEQRILDIERRLSNIERRLNPRNSVDMLIATACPVDEDEIFNQDGIPIGADLISPEGVVMTVVDSKLYKIDGVDTLFDNLISPTVAASGGEHTYPWSYWTHGGEKIGVLFG